MNNDAVHLKYGKNCNSKLHGLKNEEKTPLSRSAVLYMFPECIALVTFKKLLCQKFTDFRQPILVCKLYRREEQFSAEL